MSDYSVSICTFAVNEVVSLRICVDTILKTCDKDDLCEIIICTCERTTAETREVIAQLAENSTDVPIRNVEQPSWSSHWGEACRVMFDAAAGTHILCMTSDLECNPDYVAELIRLSKAAPEKLIKASRRMPGSVFKGYGGIRKLGNSVFQRYMELIFRGRLTDYTYSFLIAPLPVLRKTYFHKNGRTVAIELITEPLMRNVQIVEIPIVWRKREEASEKKRIFKDPVNLFWYFIVSLDIRFGTETEMV